MSPKAQKNLRMAIVYGLLAFCIIVSLIPLMSMVGTALRSKATIRTETHLFPRDPSFVFFERVIHKSAFGRYFINSILVSLFTAFVCTVVSVLGGYSLARFSNRVKGIKFYTVFLLMLQMFPIIQVIIPIYMILRQMHMTDSLRGLMMAYPAFFLPTSLWMMYGFIEGIPYEIEEAGKIDGCSRIQCITRLVLPLAAPGLATSAIMAFTGSWNEFLVANVLIRSTKFRTLTIGLQTFASEHSDDWGAVMAASTIIVIPIIIFLTVLQKYIVTGLTAGTVKG